MAWRAEGASLIGARVVTQPSITISSPVLKPVTWNWSASCAARFAPTTVSIPMMRSRSTFMPPCSGDAFALDRGAVPPQQRSIPNRKARRSIAAADFSGQGQLRFADYQRDADGERTGGRNLVWLR